LDPTFFQNIFTNIFHEIFYQYFLDPLGPVTEEVRCGARMWQAWRAAHEAPGVVTGDLGVRRRSTA
jgi:hypothetical protein